MRRHTLTALLVCGLVGAGAAPVAAGPAGTALTPGAVAGQASPAALPDLPDAAAEQAEEALEAAEELVEGDAPAEESSGEPTPKDAADDSASLVLRDLLAVVPALTGSDRRRATGLLARPTDGAADRYGDGYRYRARRVCNARLCVHYVRRGVDAASHRWARRTLKVMTEVWRHHIGKLGYRQPLQDGRRGGDRRFDVYLKNLGSEGLYGYCAPERRARPAKLASGYCVLDDDFSRREYGRAPWQSLRVTAAHEFFHAIQYAYDFLEDRWLLEATATWIEERFADGINDNRQFLRYGQVRSPGTPLDTTGLASYGNWAFFEHLSRRLGNGAVRGIWHQAADYRGAPDRHSVAAVEAVVRGRGQDFPAFFASYAGGNLVPAKSYPEGSQWRVAPLVRATLAPGASTTALVDHLASQHLIVRRRSTESSTARLTVSIGGPPASGGAAAVLVHRTSGSVQRFVLLPDAAGRASRSVAFGSDVQRVSITLTNASTRYTCGVGTEWACKGVPQDDDQLLTVSTAVTS